MHVDVAVESESRAAVGGAILGGTIVVVGVLEALTIPMRNDNTCTGSGFFCIPPSGWASVIDVAAVMLGSAGVITSIVFFAVPKTKVTVQPMVTAHGASIGVRATF